MLGPVEAKVSPTGKRHKWFATDHAKTRPKDYDLMRSRCGIVAKLSELEDDTEGSAGCVVCGRTWLRPSPVEGGK